MYPPAPSSAHCPVSCLARASTAPVRPAVGRLHWRPASHHKKRTLSCGRLFAPLHRCPRKSASPRDKRRKTPLVRHCARSMVRRNARLGKPRAAPSCRTSSTRTGTRRYAHAGGYRLQPGVAMWRRAPAALLNDSRRPGGAAPSILTIHMLKVRRLPAGTYLGWSRVPARRRLPQNCPLKGVFA